MVLKQSLPIRNGCIDNFTTTTTMAPSSRPSFVYDSPPPLTSEPSTASSEDDSSEQSSPVRSPTHPPTEPLVEVIDDEPVEAAEMKKHEEMFHGRIEDEKFYSISSALVGVDRRMDGMNGRIDGIHARMGGMADQMDSMTERIGGVEKQMGVMTARMDGMTTRMDVMTARMDSMAAEMHNAAARTRNASVSSWFDTVEPIHAPIDHVDGVYRAPDEKILPRRLDHMWHKLKHASGHIAKLTSLHRFYQTDSWRSWGQEPTLLEEDDDEEQTQDKEEVHQNLNLLDACTAYPETALIVLCKILGINYEVANHQMEMVWLRQRLDTPLKRKRESTDTGLMTKRQRFDTKVMNMEYFTSLCGRTSPPAVRLTWAELLGPRPESPKRTPTPSDKVIWDPPEAAAARRLIAALGTPKSAGDRSRKDDVALEEEHTSQRCPAGTEGPDRLPDRSAKSDAGRSETKPKSVKSRDSKRSHREHSKSCRSSEDATVRVGNTQLDAEFKKYVADPE